MIDSVEYYIARKKGNPEEIKRLEENDAFRRLKIMMKDIKTLNNDDVYFQDMLCQF
jgi:hypothetical protein